MSVQTFNPTDLPQSTANWAVAQRIVGPFAPHAQVSPDLTIALDPGYLLNGTTLTEVKAQVVGPFAPPSSGFRIDRVVVDRTTGAASVVAGTANSLTPPAIPTGKLPVARVFLESTADTITNGAIVDERALTDLSSDNAVVACRATLGGTDQTGVPSATSTKINFNTTDFNVGNGFDTTNHWFKPHSAGYYRVRGQIAFSANLGTSFLALLSKNGSSASRTVSSSGVTAMHTCAADEVFYLNGSTDKVEMYAIQNNGAPANINGQVEFTYLIAHRIG
ncbi:hypothetical protein [Azospirillum brasilense]|uniref:hypothetical protein n=1 Tax=Azospirillum brasilense TaxID=192 RepID=UPI0011EF7AA7|nr:hypothetical protein [Azospirillum brasilense]